jgi:hypothetical protein
VLLFAIYYYHTQLDVQRFNPGVVDPSKYGSRPFSHPYTIQILLFVCTFLLLIGQTFKLAQSIVPVGSFALQNVPLIYILGPVLNLIIFTVTWYPVFYSTLWERQVVFQRSQTEFLEVQNAGDYRMQEPGQYASPPPRYNGSRQV